MCALYLVIIILVITVTQIASPLVFGCSWAHPLLHTLVAGDNGHGSNEEDYPKPQPCILAQCGCCTITSLGFRDSLQRLGCSIPALRLA